MRLWSALLAGLVSAALFAPIAPARAADSQTFEYVRVHSTAESVLASCLARAKDRDSVLVVLDRITFEPISGWATGEHDYRGDLEAWYAAIRAACGGSTKRVFVTASTCDRVVEFTAASDAWRSALAATLSAQWWNEKGFRAFEPAHRWIPQLLAQVPGERKTLVLVTGALLPEKPPGLRSAEAEPWQRKLADSRAYWDEEKVAAALVESGTALYVVAPQARFGDVGVHGELRGMSWVARPARAAGARFGAPRPSWSSGPFAAESDAPSGYGHWAFARASSRSGGAYWFYPGAAAPLLDVCPRDENLVAALAPPLVSAEETARSGSTDELLPVLSDARFVEFPEIPWNDSRPADEWRRASRGIAATLARRDREIAACAEARTKLAAGALKGVSRRSAADLRLARFRFEMSAFHVEAMLLALPGDAAPADGVAQLHLARVPAIRLSDCLDAYDGRTSAALKSSFGTSPDDPDYRAKRDLDAVLFSVDPRLLPRATRMVEAAREVMKHEGRSAWGWDVYYAEAVTFRLAPAAK